MEWNQATAAKLIDIVSHLLGGSRTVQLQIEGSGPDVPLEYDSNGRAKTLAKLPSSVTITASRAGTGIRLESRRPHPVLSRKTFFGKANGGIASVTMETPQFVEVELINLPDQTFEIPE